MLKSLTVLFLIQRNFVSLRIKNNRATFDINISVEQLRTAINFTSRESSQNNLLKSA